MSAAPVNGVDHDRSRHFGANVIESLREDYRLRPDEADRAVGLYMRRKAGWATPDQAAFEAYRWWTPTVERSVVIAREAEQRTHAVQRDSGRAEPAGKPSPSEPEPGNGSNETELDPQSASERFAAFESALSMIRAQGERGGFTNHHLVLAHRIRDVLDGSPVWDTITPDASIQNRSTHLPPLEPALRPETVRPWDDWDDMIVLDAVFAGTTITVLRPPGQIGPFSYVFLSDTPNRRGTMQAADITRIGMIAAGDRQPEPSRATEYESLGKQVRNHLIGLVDAVAESRELRSEQEGRRLHATQASLGSPVDAAYQQPQPTRGTGR